MAEMRRRLPRLGGHCGRQHQHQQRRQQVGRGHHRQAAAVERAIRTLREEKTKLGSVVCKTGNQHDEGSTRTYMRNTITEEGISVSTQREYVYHSITRTIFFV